MSPHINISYVKASGSSYKTKVAIKTITLKSIAVDNSLVKASSNQTISVLIPSAVASFFQS
jgi:hypothetical protein